MKPDSYSTMLHVAARLARSSYLDQLQSAIERQRTMRSSRIEAHLWAIEERMKQDAVALREAIDRPAARARGNSMYPRTEYEMSEADMNALLDACKPTPYMIIGGYAPRSPQESANRAWASLGLRMGFDAMSVRPVAGKGARFFTAIPSEITRAGEGE